MHWYIDMFCWFSSLFFVVQRWWPLSSSNSQYHLVRRRRGNKSNCGTHGRNRSLLTLRHIHHRNSFREFLFTYLFWEKVRKKMLAYNSLLHHFWGSAAHGVRSVWPPQQSTATLFSATSHAMPQTLPQAFSCPFDPTLRNKLRIYAHLPAHGFDTSGDEDQGRKRSGRSSIL